MKDAKGHGSNARGVGIAQQHGILASSTPATYIHAHPNGQTYVLERSRAGSSKLVASVMPTHSPGGDVLMPYRKVPLDVRRGAKAHFGL